MLRCRRMTALGTRANPALGLPGSPKAGKIEARSRTAPGTERPESIKTRKGRHRRIPVGRCGGSAAAAGIGNEISSSAGAVPQLKGKGFRGMAERTSIALEKQPADGAWQHRCAERPLEDREKLVPRADSRRRAVRGAGPGRRRRFDSGRDTAAPTLPKGVPGDFGRGLSCSRNRSKRLKATGHDA